VTADPDPEDVDPRELRRQLAEIKGAMGLAEHYPGKRRGWLVYGVGVGLVIIALQATFFLPRGTLPGWLFGLFVPGFGLVVAVGLFRLAASTTPDDAPAAGLDWRVLVGSLLATALALLALLEAPVRLAATSLSTTAASRLSGAVALGAVVAVAGLGFLFVGNVLRVYRIRARDRRVFYGAGLWMLAYAAAFAQVEVLRAVGYGLFGVLLIAYSVGAYLYLGRDGDPAAEGVQRGERS